ncbi:MAG: tRNA (N(6)-L-threonylcarbamoyladenosine(37)-C(2))-methylthiotransferase MtaB, partial [Bdellovibrionales bacterium]
HGSLRRERAERLRELGARQAARHHAALIGKQFDVLVEQKGLGCTRQFAKVKINGEARTGDIVSVFAGTIIDGQVLAKVSV